MKLYRKIDLFFDGDYLCSTNQSKTLREAKAKHISTLETRKHSLGGIGLLDGYVFKNSKLLTARFAEVRP